MIVTYTEQQSVADADSFSPSAGKPRLFVEALLSTGRDIEIVAPDPVSREDLYRAHDRGFVDGVLAQKLPNGFHNRLKSVADSLPYTSGSLLAACIAALENRNFVCSPTSGFHHAEWDSAQGFCTFNGLMVAALHLKHHGRIERLAIVDCDAHYGNGTENICGVHDCYGWCLTTGRRLQVNGDGPYLRELSKLLEDVEQFRPDLMIYQAGADVHVDDPLGGMLTTEGMATRDRMVFALAAERGIPLAWNLAGGYQKLEDGSIQPVLDLHLQTFDLAVSIAQ